MLLHYLGKLKIKFSADVKENAKQIAFLIASNSVANFIRFPAVQRILQSVEIVYKSSAVAEMGDRLATIGMGQKWGGAAVGAGSPL